MRKEMIRGCACIIRCSTPLQNAAPNTGFPSVGLWKNTYNTGGIMEDFCPLLQERTAKAPPSFRCTFCKCQCTRRLTTLCTLTKWPSYYTFVLTWSWDRLSCYPIDFTSKSFLDSSFTLVYHSDNILVGNWLRSLSVHRWKQCGKINYPSILTARRNSRYYNIRGLKIFCSLWTLYSSWFELAARDKNIGKV